MSEKFPTHNPEEFNDKGKMSRRDFVKKTLRAITGLTLVSQGLILPDAHAKSQESKEMVIRVKILFPMRGDNIFPEEWNKPPINANFIPLDKSEEERSRDIIELAFKKYPPEILNKNLHSVFFVRDMSFYGNDKFGGTNSKTNVYMCNDGYDDGYDDEYLEKLYHKEFSSILLRNFPQYFNQDNWKKCNLENFSYSGSGKNAVLNGVYGSQKESLHSSGFFSEYAMSTIEKDFNSIAGELFSGRGVIWNLVDKYPRIKRKIQLAIQFYEKINPAFNERYFRELNT